MINSVQELITIMNNQGCKHWQLFNQYNATNPVSIADSEQLGENPDLSASLARLQQFFTMLGPGTYYVKYNTKNVFSKGYMADQVINQRTSAEVAKVGGVGAVIPDGYISKSELDSRLREMKLEQEISNLKSQIGSLKDGEGAKTIIDKLMDNPEISKGIGNLISKLAEAIVPPKPQLIRQTATIGMAGFDETEKTEKPEEKKPENNSDEPEHIKNLNDDQYNEIAGKMADDCTDLWFLDPEFPEVLPKLLVFAKNNPDQYKNVKGILKTLA